MGLECLLLTRDSALLSAIQAKFNELGIEILVRKDPALAVELSRRRHLDGCVIDCDDVLGGKEALSDIPGNRANKQSVMVAIVSGGISVKGQPSWLNKPLQPTSRLQEGRFTPTTPVPPTPVVTSNPR